MGTGTESPAYGRALAAARAAWGDAWAPDLATRAPGRLELLGNHIDYNGGPVLCAAIDRATVCLVRQASDTTLSFVFPDVDGEMHDVDSATVGDWRSPGGSHEPMNYVRGTLAAAQARGYALRQGIQVAVAGDVPLGFGLSSSAALCVALGLALVEDAPAGRDLVLLAQDAEIRAGTPCGTMDQSASVGGHVILYDGATTTWQSIVPDLDGYAFAVADSGVSRHLATSSYAARVRESRAALAEINRQLALDLPNIAALPAERLTEVELPSPLGERARHVVTETARVRAGVEAMRAGDWTAFGGLMTASGQSSAGDYAISHPRVEELVAAALGVPGVAGARMMGGGEGGAALVLVRSDAVDALRTALDDTYYATYGAAVPEPVQVFAFAEGARVLE